MPLSRCSPRPSSTGEIARCSSSTSPARRYCRIVATPPPRRTSLSPAASFACSSASSMPVGDEAELGAALHRQRSPLVMRQHEDRHVVRRLLAPPAAPLLVGPGAPDGPEHVPAEDPSRPCRSKPRAAKVVVRAGRAACLPVLGDARCAWRRTSRAAPLRRRPAGARGPGRARRQAVDRDREGLDDESRHRASLRLRLPVGGACSPVCPLTAIPAARPVPVFREGNRVQPSGQTAARVEASREAGARCGQRTRAAAGSAAALSDNPPRSEAAS